MRRALATELYECPRCLEHKPLDDFPPSYAYCRDCKRAYERDRSLAIGDGSWKPRPKPKAPRAPRPARLQTTIPAPVLVPTPSAGYAHTPSHTAVLRSAMEALLVERGLGFLRTTYTEIEGNLARKYRERIARDGWIA